MFPTDKRSGGASLVTQPNEGDSLTRYFRSLSNQMGTTGVGSWNTGMSTFEQGTSGVGTAQGMVGTGMGTVGKALSTLDPVAAYWNNILQGGKAATDAIAPYSTMIGTQYANAMSRAGGALPRGGYASSVSAEMPFAQSRDVGNALLQLQPMAAGKLNEVATTQGNLGGLQGNLGGIAGNLAQLLISGGLNQQGLGGNMLAQVLQALLQKNSINVQESGQNKNLAASLANTAMGGLTNIYGANQASARPGG